MSDRIEASKVIESSGNSLGMQLYIVTSTAKSLKSVNKNLSEHHAYLKNWKAKISYFAQGHC